jgi:integrase
MAQQSTIEGKAMNSGTRRLTLRQQGGYWVTGWRAGGRGSRQHTRRFGPVASVPRRQAEIALRDFEAAWLASAAIRDPGAAGPTVAALLGAHAVYAAAHYRRPSGTPTGEAENMADAAGHLQRVAGEVPVADLTAAHLKAARADMLASGLSRPTINARMARLRRVLRWGVGEGMVPPATLTVAECIPPLRAGAEGVREPRTRRPVTEEAVAKVLPLLPPPVAALVRVQLLTGARPGELFTMRPCDVATSGAVWVYVPQTHKTAHRGRRREIRLGPLAQAAIAPLLNRPVASPVFSPRDAGRRTVAGRPVAPTYSRRSYRQAIVRACRRAGVAPWSPYDLRHAAASRFRREFGEEVARALLGHARLDTTAIYGELDAAAGDRAMLRIG